jgi:LacI family transcriptional regulator
MALRRILLIVPVDIETGRGILRGVRDYAQHHGPWVFEIVYPHEVAHPLPAGSPVDGIIAHLHARQLVARVRRLRRPVVNVSNVIGDALDLPRVGSDDALVGQRAAAHFLERGFRQFAFFGYSQYAHSRARGAAFRDQLAAAGHGCAAFAEQVPRRAARSEPWSGVDQRVRPWLRALPKPVAIFTPSAARGFELLEVCRQLRLVVPHEVAVLGVDNDELLCDLATPPLSAIRTANERIGFEAAALLARLMDGEPPPAGPILVPPGEVVMRQSTDVLAVHDPALERALRFIRANLARYVQIAEVAAAAGVSRRVLERKFREVVGLSPLKEIRRLRVARAQQLLVETHLPMPAIAEQCGFPTPEMLTDVFRQQMGTPPTAYRREFSAANRRALAAFARAAVLGDEPQ